MKRRFALVFAATILAGCGGSDETVSRGATTAGGRGTGAGLAIEEALEHAAHGGTVLVKGALLERGGELRLCSGFAESHPPQCADPSLRVEGLKLEQLENVESVRLERAQGVTWSAGEVELRGKIENRVLRVRELPG